MARLLIGLPSLTGKLANYAKRYQLVELTPVDSPLPKPSKLAAWRSAVPPSFAFSVVLPRVVGALGTGEAFERALADSLEAARVLQATCIVLATPNTVRPTAHNRARIAEIAARMPQDGHVLAWHATGMWETADHLETAVGAGWLPVFDAAQEPLAPGPIVYTRIRALGHATRLGQQRIAHAARQLSGRRSAYVVVEPSIAGKVRAGLAAMMVTDRARVPMLFKPQPPGQDHDEEQ
jgi:uncharacterized protein YecE (DUF72 family)